MRLILIILAIVLAIYLVVQVQMDGKYEEAFGKRGGFGSKSISKGGGGSVILGNGSVRLGNGYGYGTSESKVTGFLAGIAGFVIGIGIWIVFYR